jgi:two-component system LytT family response regulator
MSSTAQPLRILIVDDEPPARDRIREILATAGDVEIVGEAGDGLAAAQAIQDHSPDLVFLDIRMPEMDGFGVLAALPEGALPLIVFVTAFDSFAVRAFAVHAVDYILKPFDTERLLESVERARARLLGTQAHDQERRIQGLMAELGAKRPFLERVLVKRGNRFEFVRTAEIDWIEAAGNYVTLHVCALAPLLRHTLNGIERQLDPERFRRIHRSAIVNLDRVKDIRPTLGGEYLVRLRDGTELPVSRNCRDNVMRGRPSPGEPL